MRVLALPYQVRLIIVITLYCAPINTNFNPTGVLLNKTVLILQLSRINPLCMAPLRRERCFWLTPNEILMAHASVVCQVQDCSMAVLPVQYT